MDTIGKRNRVNSWSLKADTLDKPIQDNDVVEIVAGTDVTVTASETGNTDTLTIDVTGSSVARGALSVTGAAGLGSLSYSSATGVFTYNAVTTAEVRAQVSVTDAGGDGSLSYSSATGVITYTGPSAAETRAHFTGGDGITYTSSTGDFDVDLTDTVIFNSSNTVSTAVVRDASGNFSAGTITAALSGNASTATTLETARTISLSGDVSGSVSFNGSANVDIAATIQANSVALGTDTTGNYMVNVSGTANEIEVTHTQGEGSTATIGLPNDVTIGNNLTVTGDLTVNGTTTTLNTATLDVEDTNITLNAGAGDTSGSADGAGITIQDAVNSTTDATLTWIAASDRWQFSHDAQVGTNRMFHDGYHPNADTLTTARSIGISLSGDVSGSGSASFDGSGNITISATNMTVGANSVALGTDTTGNYMVNVTAGQVDTTDGITISHTQAEGSTATISHANTSSQASSNNSGNTFIQDITLDTYGHITALGTATVSIGNGTLTLNTSGNGISGSQTFTANQGTAATFTVTSNATDANTASTIVYRNASGNFSAGTITAALSGNASTATTWETARTATVTLTGDVTGTAGVSVDGSGNWTNSIATTVGNDSHTHAFNNLTGKTSGTGNYQTTGDFIADNFEATGLGPNVTPGTDDAYFGGYGVLGDRASNPVYLSNVSGPVALNHTGVHGTNTKLETTSTGISVTGNIAVSGTVDGRDLATDGSKLDGIESNAKDDQTITAGNGLTGGGTGNVTLNVGAGSGITVAADTVAHADTSTQASVDNSGNTFIQDITLDGFGHITGLASATVSIGNGTQTVTAGSGLTGGGSFTANQSGNTSVTVNVGAGTGISVAADTVAVAAVYSPNTATELSNAINLDTLLQGTDAGFYYQAANADTTGNNYPVAQAGSLLVQRSASSGSYGATQMYITYNNSSASMYFRAGYGSVGAWREVHHTGNTSTIGVYDVSGGTLSTLVTT